MGRRVVLLRFEGFDDISPTVKYQFKLLFVI
jgi:hypothetical protein